MYWVYNYNVFFFFWNYLIKFYGDNVNLTWLGTQILLIVCSLTWSVVSKDR